MVYDRVENPVLCEYTCTFVVTYAEIKIEVEETALSLFKNARTNCVPILLVLVHSISLWWLNNKEITSIVNILTIVFILYSLGELSIYLSLFIVLILFLILCLKQQLLINTSYLFWLMRMLTFIDIRKHFFPIFLSVLFGLYYD